MIPTPRQNLKPPKTKFISLTDWKKGTISGRPAARIPFDALAITNNVKLGIDGTVSPRGGLKLYGTQPTNTPIGGPYEFVKVVDTVAEAWLIWAENDDGTGKIYIAKNGGAATLVTGKTYDARSDAEIAAGDDVTPRIHFEQVADVVMISNGVDNLSYMDISTSTITEYTALSTPTITSVTQNGLTGSTITYYYGVTASNQGETAGSTPDSVSVSKDHSQWNGSTENVDINFPRVTGADNYNIYRGTENGKLYYLTTVQDPGSGTVTYTDTGALYTNANRPMPEDDSTAGPKVTRITNIKGQPWMVGDMTPGNEGRIWYGGTSYSNALDFSPIGDGGWVEPNKGGKDFPVKVLPFRDGLGTPMPVCLSKSTNGRGKRYLLQYKTQTFEGLPFTYVAVQEDNGQDGTDSPDAVISVNDSLFYPSRDAFKTSKTKANVQNIISTSGVSQNIADRVKDLSSSSMSQAVGLVDNEIIYWALPYLGSTNNQIWTLDLRNKGAWMAPYTLSADWMTLYSDNATGKTIHLIVSGDNFYELDENTLTADNGVTFQTSIGSGHIRFSDDGMIWGTVLDVTFVFLSALGIIDLQTAVHTEEGIITKTDVVDTTTIQSVSSWGSFSWGNVGWGNIENNLPQAVLTTEDRIIKTIDIDEDVDWLTWGVSTSNSGVTYELSEVIVRYVPIGFIEQDD